MKNWIISNIQKEAVLEHYIDFGDFALSFDGDFVRTFDDSGIYIGIDGYIIPREFCFTEYKHLRETALVMTLFKKYGVDFIRYIKGIFNIILIKDESFFLFNDRHSVKKFLVYEENGKFIVSNSLSIISDQVALEIDRENAALFCLVSHFVNGNTLYQNLTYSKPATVIEFNKSLNIRHYWIPGELLQSGEKIRSLKEFSENWRILIKNFLEYFNPRQIALTLTGGNDSRLILATLLTLKAKPKLFSYGDPLSSDVLTAKRIAEATNLKFSNHFIPEPTEDWFRKSSLELIEQGNSLLNIHRAHRYDAAMNEKEICPNVDLAISGLMGGEYIKEPGFNDLVLPKIFKEISEKKNYQKRLKLLQSKLIETGIDQSTVDLELILRRIEEFLSQTDHLNTKQKIFVLTYLYYGATHHTQDAQIFNTVLNRGMNPYMDIDFLEALSSSEFWYLNKRNRIYRKLFHSKPMVLLTHSLCPKLSDIPYAKKGEYSANDLLGNPFIYLIKRLIRKLASIRKKSPPNFPMGDWLFQFCLNEVNSIHNGVDRLFENGFLNESLLALKNKKQEKDWHLITNPINLSLILKKYEKK